jgi:hypothetical protein
MIEKKVFEVNKRLFIAELIPETAGPLAKMIDIIFILQGITKNIDICNIKPYFGPFCEYEKIDITAQQLREIWGSVPIIQAMKHKGYSNRAIAYYTGLSEQTILNYLKEKNGYYPFNTRTDQKQLLMISNFIVETRPKIK